MKKNRETKDTEYLDLSEDALSGGESSRLRGTVFFILCSILVLSTIGYGAVDVWAVGLLSLLTGLIALLWLADSFFRREFSFSSSRIQFPLFGLLLIGLIQLLPLRSTDVSGGLLSIPAASALTLDPFATKLFIIQLCIYIIFFGAMLTLVESEKRQRILVFTIIVFGSIMGFFGVIQSLTNTNPNSILGMRENPGAFPFATFINRHHFAAFMNMTLGLTLGLLYGNATKRDKRLLLIIALALMGIAMMFTGSRGGIISLFGVVAFVVLINLFSRKVESDSDEETRLGSVSRNFLLVGSGLALVLLLIGSAVFFGGESAVTRGLGLGGQMEISNGRFHFWQVALQIFRHNPILGTGLDSFSMAYPLFDTWNGQERVEQAHNDYLQILADAGILGFICLTAFIYFLYQKGLQVINRTDDRFRRGVAVGALAGCFGILVHSFFDFPLRTPSNAFFFLSLAALATVAGVPTKRQHRRRTRRSN